MSRAKSLPVAVLAGAAALLAFVGASHEASAEPYVVLEPGVWILPPSGDWGTSAGLGGNVVGGIGLDLDPLLLSPQLALGVWGFPGLASSPDVALAESSSAAEDGPTRTMSNFRATVGWSVGIAAPIETQVYARIGLGLSDDYSRRDLGAGLAIDAGATGDYRLSRDVTLGLQAGYQGFAAFETGTFANSARSIHGITVCPRFGFWF